MSACDAQQDGSMVPPQQQQQQLNYDSHKCMQRSSLAAATEGCSCMLFADLPSLQHVVLLLLLLQVLVLVRQQCCSVAVLLQQQCGKQVPAAACEWAPQWLLAQVQPFPNTRHVPAPTTVIP